MFLSPFFSCNKDDVSTGHGGSSILVSDLTQLPACLPDPRRPRPVAPHRTETCSVIDEVVACENLASPDFIPVRVRPFSISSVLLVPIFMLCPCVKFEALEITLLRAGVLVRPKQTFCTGILGRITSTFPTSTILSSSLNPLDCLSPFSQPVPFFSSILLLLPHQYPS